MTLSCVPVMLPETTAPPVPAGQKEPAGQRVPTGDTALAAQIVPALHGKEVARVLPEAVQKPAVQLPVHADVESPAVAPNLPAAQSVGAAEPATQKAPAGHCTCWVFAKKVGQKKPAEHPLALDDALPSARQAPVLGHALHAGAPVLLKVPTAQERPAPAMAAPGATV